MNVEDTILTPGPSLDSTISDEDIANIFSEPTKPQPKEDGSSTDSGHSTDISGDSKNDSTEQTGEIEAEKGEEGGEESAKSGAYNIHLKNSPIHIFAVLRRGL